MQNMKDISFNVKGMHCKSCEVLITDELEEIKDVTIIHISSNEGIVKISYDETKNSEEDLKKVIMSVGDYEVL